MASRIGLGYRREEVSERLAIAVVTLAAATGIEPVAAEAHRDPEVDRLNAMEALAETIERAATSALMGMNPPTIVVEEAELLLHEGPSLEEIAAAAFVTYAADKRSGSKHDEDAFVEAFRAAWPELPEIGDPVLDPETGELTPFAGPPAQEADAEREPAPDADAATEPAE